MTKPFPNDPFLQGYFAPMGIECDAEDLIVEGELPSDLAGTYYRNGPDPLYPPRENDYHWFDGDGMVHAFRFANGRVSYRNRWVRTEKFKLEREAGKSLFGILGNPMTADPASHGKEYNTANTHIVSHGGKLLALMEGAVPVELEHGTLSTVGRETYGGVVEGPFTAHPKIDMRTGEMFAFGYQVAGPGSLEMRYDVIDANNKMKKSQTFNAPYSCMVHDFAVSENYAFFPFLPVTVDIERVIGGGPAVAWEPDKSSYFAILPRYGSVDDIIWVEADARFSFHIMNAWEDGKRLIVDLSAGDNTHFFPGPDGKRAKFDNVQTQFRRWSFDLSSDKPAFEEEKLDEIMIEFPRIDDRWCAYEYTHGFAVGTPSKDAKVSFDTLYYYNAKTNERRSFSLGANWLLGEPVVAPRVGSDQEADGYVILLAYNSDTGLSDVLVMNAQDLEAGPVARVKLPLRVPAGFHGSWVP